eukprot:CAMPEP_0116089856 /NCGR_PEP_ID=MMETSP0327-20121206/6642_1 /TAXON_ID=44447 /ORGANISM="Pseudo-nitzschia delicatissima, Strain B596" /LENGTH=153 /DNA_ID=CAMNT_0003581063 /DNA_START=543 /DNA_END=1003 /DNA_ORIENTATION=+
MLPIRYNSSCDSVSIPVNLFASLDSSQQRASGDRSMGMSTFSPLLAIDARLFRVNDTEEHERMTEETRRGLSPKEKNLLLLDTINATLAALEDARMIDERQTDSTTNASIPPLSPPGINSNAQGFPNADLVIVPTTKKNNGAERFSLVTFSVR